MNHRERFRAVVEGRPVDRLPMIEWATWWHLTLDRWRGEGLPGDRVEPWEVAEFFGLDPYRQCWITAIGHGAPPEPVHGAGRLNGELTESAYERLRPHLYPNPAVDVAFLRPWAEAHRRGEMVVWITLEGFFWFPRMLLGIENHLYAFYDAPELMHRINADLVAYHLRVLDEFCAVLTPDYMTFAEDFSYNSGPMLSEALFEEFMRPYYEQVVPVLRERGIVPMVDSDGDISAAVPWMERAGLRGALPMERRSGVDVAMIRREHPDFFMIGGFDKTVMSQGRSAMAAEFERLAPVMRSGRFIPSVDHQTPPDVSLACYRDYVALLREAVVRDAPTGAAP